MEPLPALGTRPGHSPGTKPHPLWGQIRTLSKLQVCPRDAAAAPHPSSATTPTCPREVPQPALGKEPQVPGMGLLDNLASTWIP